MHTRRPVGNSAVVQVQIQQAAGWLRNRWRYSRVACFCAGMINVTEEAVQDLVGKNKHLLEVL